MSIIDAVINAPINAARSLFGGDAEEPARAPTAGTRERTRANSRQQEGRPPAEDSRPGRTATRSTTSFAGPSPASQAAHALIADAVRRATQGGAPEGDRVTPPPVAEVTQPGTDAGASTRAAAASLEPASAAHVRPAVRVFDGGRPDAEGRATYIGSSRELGTSGAGDAATAAHNVERGLDWLRTTFGRDGVDDAGTGVDIVLNDSTTDASGRRIFEGNGAWWTTRFSDGQLYQAMRFGSGIERDDPRGGTIRQRPMFTADDLTIHELVHGVIKHETGHIGGEADEASAVNESVADVLAAAATRDWRIGEGMYDPRSSRTAMRNIAQPSDPSAVHPLWTSVQQMEQAMARGERFEEHYASGLISHAAARIQQRLGGESGWQAVEQLFYRAVQDRALGDMSFAAAAAGLRATASRMWGEGSTVAALVDEELRAAGL